MSEKQEAEQWGDWQAVIKVIGVSQELWWERWRGKEYQSIKQGEMTYELNRIEAELRDTRQLLKDVLPHISLAILPGPLDARLVQFVDALSRDTSSEEA